MPEMPSEAVAEVAFEEHEHRELIPGLNRIHDVADIVGRAPTHQLATAVRGVTDWIGETLTPHIAWEETSLYPRIDARAGTEWATRLMRFEHKQILAMARQVAADRTLLIHEPDHRQLCDLRSRLFGLETMLRAHVEREDRFLIPLLEAEG